MGEAWRTRTLLVHGGSRALGVRRDLRGDLPDPGLRYLRAEDAAEALRRGAPGFIYARYGNPTVRMFEERMALLEGAEDAAATASGMAAVHAALFSQLKAGDHVVAARALFGSCLYIVRDPAALRRRGHASSTAPTSTQWAAALRPTRLVFLESPATRRSR